MKNEVLYMKTFLVCYSHKTEQQNVQILKINHGSCYFILFKLKTKDSHGLNILVIVLIYFNLTLLGMDSLKKYLENTRYDFT